MPRFDLGQGQVEALTAFLFSLPGPELRLFPASLHGDSDRGKVAVASRRCATCHVVEGRGGSLGTTLDAAGAKIAPSWLFNYLTDTHRVRPRTRMPGFRIPDDEAADIVAYAGEQWVPDTPELPWSRFAGPARAELAGEGRALFVELGCRGCHRVAGVPLERVGMAMRTMADRHLAELPPGIADVPSWVARKCREPHAFDLPGGARAQMPAYSIDDAEALAIGVAVASLRPVRTPGEYLRAPPAGVMPGGSTGKVIDRFRCLVCHTVRGEGGTVARVPLDGEGSRVQRPWLESFLRSPVTLRMDQSERMPLLGIDDASAKLLASWIETSLTDDRIADGTAPSEEDISRGKELFLDRGCPSCHVAGGQGTMKGPVLDGARDRLQPGYVAAMLERGSSVVPEQRHPDGTMSHESARAIAAYVCSLELPESLRAPTSRSVSR
jgi:mono/diheme cytochrome c family protein